jgi:cyclophilin family peptidyl-prolyl cis-trans isomerase/HEAT repeat protein
MKSMAREVARALFLLVAAHSAAAAQDPAAVLKPYAKEWERLIAAEDARAPTRVQLGHILTIANSSNEPELRRLAARALGRLERPSLVDNIAPLLRDASPRVRAEAAHALGQALVNVGLGDPAHAAARQQLTSALSRERDAAVISAIAETLGRSRHLSAAEARVTLGTLLPLLDRSGTALGAARGIFFLARHSTPERPPLRAAFDAATRAALLRKAAGRPTGAADPEAARIRALTAAALIAADTVTEVAALSAILRDPDASVRREATIGLANLRERAEIEPLVLEAMSDSPVVRVEALRVYGRRLAGARGCDPVVRAARDANPNVALTAIDLLGRSCVATPTAVALLDSLTRTLPDTGRAWHRPAHALMSLARIAPDSARRRLAAFTAHSSFFVRTYAANAATTLGDSLVLKGLANHANPNVRAAAVAGLKRVLGRGADSILVAQLDQDDGQLLLAVVEALDSTRRTDAVPALLNALDRLSAAKRETSRDARVALISRVQSLGNPSLEPRLRPYLRDFDPVIAESAASVLRAWTNTRPQTNPAELPEPPVPTFEEAAALSRARAVIEMADGSQIELELLPFDAPTNAARFARLARAGHYDKTTFHRVVPNFVIQGGSPSANEYAGDGPFTRDEVGGENRRATVGISTRGRDTGDAQIFINLVDNVRLDHDYTVFARVVQGMQYVDLIQEGAEMVKVTIR